MTEREAVDWYDANADHYSTAMVDRPIVELIAWPGLESLLPDLASARVLDAGCGDGTYTRRLADRGADVIGVDASRDLLAIAEERHGATIDFRHADLRDPFDFLERDEIDVVVSQLALDHIEDWGPVFEEFARVLAPGGAAVVSVSNPPAIWAKIDFDDESEERFDLASPSYFDVEPWRPVWSQDDAAPRRVQKYRRPLSQQVGAAFDAGFVMDGLVEPAPTDAFEDKQPERAARWGRRPSTFICYRFRNLGKEQS